MVADSDSRSTETLPTGVVDQLEMSDLEDVNPLFSSYAPPIELIKESRLPFKSSGSF